MKRNISRRDAIRAVGAAGLVGLAGCSGGDGGDGGDATPTATPTESGDGTDGSDGTESVRAAWVYNTEVGDLGWSWAHNEGRKASAETYDWLETDFTASVAPEDSQRVFAQYANDGYDVVFGCSFGYQDPMVTVASDHPDTVFEHCSGYRTRENMGRYFGRIYQSRYMTGVAAGMVTEANSLGYVAAFPIPEVIRGINAFTLGAASVNEDVTTQVRWTNTWFDPPKEQEAANALIDEGVDVMAQHQDSAAAVRAASDAGIWATGYDAPMNQFGGEEYLTSPIWHWEAFYNPTLESVKQGSWTSDAYWKGLNAGIVDISEWGPEVPEDVKSEVADTREAIANGDADVWADSKFAGESDEFLFQNMSSYVEEVEGSVPS